MTILLTVLVLCVAGLAYIRLTPSDIARWHVPLTFDEDADFSDGAQRVLDAGPDGLAQIDRIALLSPRTTVLSGSVAEGRITYITRSRGFGFPDYITAQQDGDTLKLYSRLRFGASDLGVNRDRLEEWSKSITGRAD